MKHCVQLVTHFNKLIAMHTHNRLQAKNPMRLNSLRFGLLAFFTAALVACGNSVPSGLIATNVPLVTQSVTGGTEMVQQLFISKAEEVVPGKIDYTLTAIVCNRGITRATQNLKLLSKDISTQVMSDTLVIPANHYGQCKLTQGGAWVVRSDKDSSLDFTKLAITDTSQTQSDDAPVRFVKVDLYSIGGRAGHEALLAANLQHVQAGKTVLLRASLTGDVVSVDYRLVDSEGNKLSEGKMTQASDMRGDPYRAQITIPSGKFKVVIDATSTDGARYNWTTDEYMPDDGLLAIQMSNAVVTDASSILSGRISGKANAPGPLSIAIYPPKGYTVSWMSRTVETNIGDDVAVNFTLSPNGLKITNKDQILVIYKYAFGEPVLIKAFVLDARI